MKTIRLQMFEKNQDEFVAEVFGRAESALISQIEKLGTHRGEDNRIRKHCVKCVDESQPQILGEWFWDELLILRVKRDATELIIEIPDVPVSPYVIRDLAAE